MRFLAFCGRICLVLCAACGLPVESSSDVSQAAQALSAHDAVLHLTLSTPEVRDAGLAIKGRTNVALTSAMAFVPDDEVGQTSLVTGGFETLLPLSEVKARLIGGPLFFSLATQDAQTHARAVIGLSLPASCSTSKVRFERPLQSAIVDGVTVLRMRGTTKLASAKVQATVSGGAWPTPVFAGTRSRDAFTIDVPVDVAAAAALTRTPLSITLQSGSTKLVRSCVPGLVLRELELSTADPYDFWPAPVCDDTRRSCLAQKSHQSDTSACGDAFHVQACGPRPKSQLCSKTLAGAFSRTLAGSLWMSETDAPFSPVVLPDAGGSLADALRAALGTPADAVVEVRNLDDVLSWPTQDPLDEGTEMRLQAAVYRAFYQQLVASLTDVQVVRIGSIQIDVYFVGRDACGNLVGVKTLAVET
jgi:hypothetical protein